MAKAYDPKARADDFHVEYVVNASGDRFFIPYNDNDTKANQVKRCQTMSGWTTGESSYDLDSSTTNVVGVQKVAS